MQGMTLHYVSHAEVCRRSGKLKHFGLPFTCASRSEMNQCLPPGIEGLQAFGKGVRSMLIGTS